MSAGGDWLAVHRALFDHPKTKRLSKRLGVDVSAACGYLICLWTWAMTVAPEGDLSRYDPEEIEAAAGWGGVEELLYANLVSCRWLDEDRYIHDWQDWRGPLVTKRARDAERKRIERASKTSPSDAVRTSDPRPADVPVKTDKTDKTDKTKSIKSIPSAVPSEDFILWWGAYGKVGSRADANDLYRYWRNHGASPEDLVVAATNYRAWCVHTNTSQKHGSTFLSKKPNRWLEHVKPEYELNGNKPKGHWRDDYDENGNRKREWVSDA